MEAGGAGGASKTMGDMGWHLGELHGELGLHLLLRQLAGGWRRRRKLLLGGGRRLHGKRSKDGQANTPSRTKSERCATGRCKLGKQHTTGCGIRITVWETGVREPPEERTMMLGEARTLSPSRERVSAFLMRRSSSYCSMNLSRILQRTPPPVKAKETLASM